MIAALAVAIGLVQAGQDLSSGACPRCEIVLSRPVVLDKWENGEGLPIRNGARAPAVDVDRSGQILLGTWNAEVGPPLVFDGRTGRFLRTLGTKGQGPGEFLASHALQVLPGDSVLVWDGANNRFSLLGPGPEHRFVRGVYPPKSARVSRVLRLRNGQLVMAGSIPVLGRSPETAMAGQPLHVFSAAGDHLISFGAVEPKLIPGLDYTLGRVLAESPDGKGFWSAPIYGDPVFALWGPNGKQIRTLRRRLPSWFVQTEGYRPPTRAKPPTSLITDIEVDAEGLLWVVMRVHDPTWKEGLSSTSRRVEGVEINDIVDWFRVWDTVVEVIDPVTRSILATRRFDGHIAAVFGGRFLLEYRLKQDGEPYLVVHDRQLRGWSRAG